MVLSCGGDEDDDVSSAITKRMNKFSVCVREREMVSADNHAMSEEQKTKYEKLGEWTGEFG